MSSNNYRAWLVKLVMHIGVRDCTRIGTTSLEEIREELLDLGVLAGYERAGDVFMLDLYRLGPFYRDDSNKSLFRKHAGAVEADFPHPGAAPMLIDPPPVEPEAPKNIATGKKLPPKLGAIPYVGAVPVGKDAHGVVLATQPLPRGVPLARALPPLLKDVKK